MRSTHPRAATFALVLVLALVHLGSPGPARDPRGRPPDPALGPRGVEDALTRARLEQELVLAERTAVLIGQLEEALRPRRRRVPGP